MNTDASKSSLWNHWSKMSKMARSGLRDCRPGCALALDPAVRPDVLAALEEGQDEGIFGGEVPVERGLGDACVLDDLVDPTARIPRRENSS